MIEKFKNNMKLFSLFSVINLRHYWWFYLFISLGIIFSISLISYFQMLGQPGEVKNLMNWAFWFFLNVGTANITSSGLGIYGNKSTRIHLLTIPVSNFIRVFSLFFYAILIPLIVFTLIYTATANVLVGMYAAMDFTDPFVFNPLKLNNFLLNLLTFFVVQSFLLMIGSFYTKVAIVKTVVSLVGLLLVILIIDSITASYSVDRSIFWNMFNLFGSSKNVGIALVNEIPPLIMGLKYIASILIIPVSIYIVFLRVKELEV